MAAPVGERDRVSKAPTGRASLPRYVGAVSGWRIRVTIGIAVAAGAVGVAFAGRAPHERLLGLSAFGSAWLIAVGLTDKYRHKYPYRYYSYLFASHAKSAAILAVVLGVVGWLFKDANLLPALWQAFAVFVVADFAISVPRRLRPLSVAFDPAVLKSREIAAQAEQFGSSEASATPDRPRTTFRDVAGEVRSPLSAHIQRAFPASHSDMETLIVTDLASFPGGSHDGAPVDLVVCQLCINDQRRINRFFLRCAEALRMDGYLVCEYEPLESRRDAIERRFGRFFWPVYLLHFAWYRVIPKLPMLNKGYFALTRGRNRVISKAEVWGRLSFCGLRVLAEEDRGGRRIVTAQRVAPAITNKVPSYYPVVGLTKVGLDGQLLQTHKVRSMYPFSEFLQKQVFDANGLVGTGKFRNDFRLTEYGKFLRRHWIDELPQLFDWLRGDIKLVGIRATSPHFLSLYPTEFIQQYVLVKPGLVPPLFDEGTDGFDAIVLIEARYLRDYSNAPFRTDAKLLWDTFSMIVFQGVRSK